MIIQDLQSNIIFLDECGIKALLFEPDSPIPRHTIDEVDGRDGHLHLNTQLEGRTIQASFVIRAKNKQEYIPKRNYVFSLFDARKEFYIIDEREPHKRWKVRTSKQYKPTRLSSRIGNFDIEFISTSTYAESTGTTLNPSFNFQVKEAHFNNHPIQYSFDTNTFFVWNDGDTTIDPREHPLTITFVGDSPGDLTIENFTTSETWTYSGSTTINDTIKLDGIRFLKNDASIFRDTNRKPLTLKEGWNEFKVSFATNFTISFDFPFYYL